MLKFGIFALTLLAAGSASAQTSPQNTQMARLDMMRGVWKGEAKGMGPGGQPYSVTQTERVGAMNGGDLLVIEGRGYDGATLKFNAFGVISWNPQAQVYEFRAYNSGYAITAPLKLDGTTAVWEMPAGPNTSIRFTLDFSTVGVWHETGQYIAAGQPPRPILDMTLKHVGDTDWPAIGAVLP